MATAKPKLKAKVEKGNWEIKAAKAFFSSEGHQLVSYKIEVTAPNEKVVGTVTSLKLSSGKEMRTNFPVYASEFEGCLNGNFNFDYPFLSLQKLLQLGRRDWEKVKLGTPGYEAGDFGMAKNPKLREKLTSLQIGGVTQHEVFRAYNALNNDLDASAVQSFTSWVDVTNALARKSTFDCSNPEGTDGWR